MEYYSRKEIEENQFIALLLMSPTMLNATRRNKFFASSFEVKRRDELTGYGLIVAPGVPNDDEFFIDRANFLLESFSDIDRRLKLEDKKWYAC